MPRDVFHLHDSIVNEDAGRQGDGQKADQVEREAEQLHDIEGRDGRQWQRHGCDQRRPPVPQEQEHHKNRKQRAFDQRMQSRFVVAIGVEHRVIDRGQLHIRIVGADLIKRLRHHLGHGNLARALGAEHGKGDHLVAVETAEGPEFLVGVVDRAKFAEPDIAAVRQRNCGVGQGLGVLGVAQCPDRLFAVADFPAAAAQIGIGCPELPVHIGCGDAIGVQPGRIKFDADFPVGTAIAIHLGDAALTLQRPLDGVIHKPGRFLQRHVGRIHGKRHDRLALDIDAGDNRFLHRGRQVATNPVDGILDVLHRLVGRHLHAEDHIGRGNAVGYRRHDVVDTGDSGDRVLDFLGDLGLDLRRSGARLDHGDRHQRNVDVWKPCDWQRQKGLDADNRQQHECQDRRDRIADGPGGKIHLGSLTR
jgi:hypothetical protein